MLQRLQTCRQAMQVMHASTLEVARRMQWSQRARVVACTARSWWHACLAAALAQCAHPRTARSARALSRKRSGAAAAGRGPTSCPVTRMTVLLHPGSRGARRCAASAHQPAAVACAAAPCHWTLAALLLQHHRGCSRQPEKPTMRVEAGALAAAAVYGHNSDGGPAGALLATGCRLPLMAAPANEQGCKAYL